MRVIVTPLGIAGTVAEKMLLPAGSKAESYDAMLLDFAQQWRSGWTSDDIGEQGNRYQFPDGLKAFSYNQTTGPLAHCARCAISANSYPRGHLMERRPESRHTSMGGEGVVRIGDARTIFVVVWQRDAVEDVIR